jgi:hypothetical protein
LPAADSCGAQKNATLDRQFDDCGAGRLADDASLRRAVTYVLDGVLPTQPCGPL